MKHDNPRAIFIVSLPVKALLREQVTCRANRIARLALGEW
jgi:hypothetical protein